MPEILKNFLCSSIILVALRWIPVGQERESLMGCRFQPVLLLQCNSGFALSLKTVISSESKN